MCLLVLAIRSIHEKQDIHTLLIPAFTFLYLMQKESPVSIVGQWRSVSIYTIQDNGTYNWCVG